MAESVICIAHSEAQAEIIVTQLKQAGFAYNDISVLFPDKIGKGHLSREHQTKAPEGAIAGVGTGGVLGGALGLMAGLGALTIPGVGPFMAAGPILAALSGAALGAAMGGIAGALIGMGIPEYEAKRYAGKIQKGSVLICVNSETSEETATARQIFACAGAEDISTAGEGIPEKPDVSSSNSLSA
jgi:uncharacterized membrane protein